MKEKLKMNCPILLHERMAYAFSVALVKTLAASTPVTPRKPNYPSKGEALACLVILVAGIALCVWMAKL